MAEGATRKDIEELRQSLADLMIVVNDLARTVKVSNSVSLLIVTFSILLQWGITEEDLPDFHQSIWACLLLHLRKVMIRTSGKMICTISVEILVRSGRRWCL